MKNGTSGLNKKTMGDVMDSLNGLLAYCRDQDWEGFDPFDGLNSRVFQFLPYLKNSRLARMALIQFNKRSPLNLRPLLGIKKGRNPKGMGLFLAALVNLYKISAKKEYLDLIEEFAGWLEANALPGFNGKCWGYNFDWQSRAFFLPRGTPTVVNTSFIARAFLSAHAVIGKPEYLAIARSACDFILNDLNREESSGLCFSYSPRDHYFVHNATALAASVLAGVSVRTGEEPLASIAKKSIQHIADHQRPDGSWSYGEDSTAQRTGTDNFHTGFILESLKVYSDALGESGLEPVIKRGLDFYQSHFFLGDGAPKYFPNQKYPLDIHSAAQSIVTLVQLKEYGADQSLCRSVVSWMIREMRNPKGYFYYQKHRFFTNRIPYIRWGQAWTFHALASYLVSYGSHA
jgi:hypothetical protein